MKVKQNYPLGAKYSIIKFPAFIGLIIIIISLTSANFVVTHDGYLYLNSANYLFKTNFELEYQWLREPGYPIILRLRIYIDTKFDAKHVFLYILCGVFL